MRLSPIAFNAHLNGMGQAATWKRAHACPCRDPNSGAAKPGCPICGSRGWYWDAPVNAVAGVAGQQAQKQWANFGKWQAGDVVVTIGSDSPLYNIGEFDRVILLNAPARFSYVLTRGDGDTLTGQVQTITAVTWLTPDGTALVAGGIPTVASDGTLTWTSGEPPAGTEYTIEGTAYPEYYSYIALPSSRNEHQGAALPKKIVLRRFDLFGREGG